MIDLGKFISNCRYPRTILNKNGTRVSVSCGRCVDCANKKSVRYTSLCNNACQEFKYVRFITLKYDEFNVPRMRLIEKDGNVYCVDITKRALKTPGKYKTLFTYGKIINTFYKDKKFDSFYEKADITSKFCEKLPFKNLRWCSSEDLQKFLKRLRFYISKSCSSPISFFAVSEYGPRTFRPHFHILLYTDDRRIVENLIQLVAQSWKYGSFLVETPKSDAGVSRYVTSYINSVVTLPRYFVSRQVLPRSFHSLHFGQLANKEIRNYVYSSPTFQFDRVKLSTSFGDRDYLPTSYFNNLLFPKCYNFKQQNFADLVYLYRIYQDLVEEYSSSCVSELTKKVILNAPNHNRLLSLLNVPYLDLSYLSYQLQYDILEFKKMSELSDYQLKLFNRIYSIILMSKHVLNWCLEVDFEKYFNSDSMYTLKEFTNISLGKFISRIKSFYNAQEKHLLHCQLVAQDSYMRENIMPFKFDTSTLFNLLQSVVDYEKSLLEHLFLFYPVGTLDYLKKYQNSSIMRTYNLYKDDMYSQKIKHKEVNDANLIFVDV